MNENGSTAAAVPLENGQATTPAIKIDDGIPVPERWNTARSGVVNRTLHVLEVGQSFVAPTLDGDRRKTSIYVARTANKLHPKKFATRVVEENGERVVRVWRVS